MTRSEYREAYLLEPDKEEQFAIHHRYYAQFVTPRLLDYVRSKIHGIEWKDTKYFNDKPIEWWDRIAGIVMRNDRPIINDTYVSRIQLKILQEGLSASSIICIYKAAARIIYAELKEKQL